MFEQPHHEFTKTDLALKCCDSALSTLDPDCLDEEFGHLIKSKYVRIPLGGTLFKGGSRYLISEKGIIFVRQNLAKYGMHVIKIKFLMK